MMDWAEAVANMAAADLFLAHGTTDGEAKDRLLSEVRRIHEEARLNGFGSVRWIVHGCTGCGSRKVADGSALQLIRTPAVLKSSGKPLGIRLCPMHIARLKQNPTSLDEELLERIIDMDGPGGTN